jgi:hypothetical protein
MTIDSRKGRNYGLSPVHATGIILSCALVFMALLALIPDA